MSQNKTTGQMINKTLWQQFDVSQVDLANQILQGQKQIADSLFKTLCKHNHLVQDKIKVFKLKFQKLQKEAYSSHELIMQQIHLNQNINSQMNGPINQTFYDDKAQANVQKFPISALQLQSNDKHIKRMNRMEILRQSKHLEVILKMLASFYKSEMPQFQLNIDYMDRLEYKKRLNAKCFASNIKVPKLYLLTIYQKQCISYYLQTISQTIKNQLGRDVLESLNDLIANKQSNYQKLQNILTYLTQILFQQYRNLKYCLKKKMFTNHNAVKNKSYNYQKFYRSYFNCQKKIYRNQENYKSKEQFSLQLGDFLTKDVAIYSCGFCRQKYIESDYDNLIFNGVFSQFSEFFTHIIEAHNEISEDNSHLIIGLNKNIQVLENNLQIKSFKLNEYHKNWKMHGYLKKMLQKNMMAQEVKLQLCKN